MHAATGSRACSRRRESKDRERGEHEGEYRKHQQ